MKKQEPPKPVLKSRLTEKTYYLITHPDVPDLYVENFGDRVFKLYGKFRGYSISDGILMGGDRNWPITLENIHRCGHFLLEQEIAERTAEAEKQAKKKAEPKKKFKPWECQSCGEQVGYLGRFFGFHVCTK